MGKLRRMLRADLEAGAAERAFGTGWITVTVHSMYSPPPRAQHRAWRVSPVSPLPVRRIV